MLHAILGPSAASRWLACTPSARFEEQIPVEESPYAAEGTLAHELGALILSGRTGLFYDDWDNYERQLAELMRDEWYSAEMRDYIEDYVDYVISLGGEILIEHRYDLSAYVPLSFGTSDATNYVLESLALYITDLKYGAGVYVGATENTQTMLYGLGALLHFRARGYKVETVVMNIYQPRIGGVSTWEISADALIQWAEIEVMPKALLAISGQGQFVTGKHCQFCKARTSCRAFYDMFSDLLDIHDKRAMTSEELAHVLYNGDTVAGWIKKVKDDAMRKLERAESIPGFKLVAGKGRRSFRNEDNVVDILIGEGIEDIFNVALKSLTDFEKTLGKKKFEKLFKNELIKLDGAPILADATDPRPTLGKSRVNDFDDADYEDLT